MFKILLYKKRNMMTLGGQGISKTVAIIMFNQLSSIINQYLYKAFSDPE
jgi:hypothetical protein